MTARARALAMLLQVEGLGSNEADAILDAVAAEAQANLPPLPPTDLRRRVIFARINPAVMDAFGKLAGKAALGCEGTMVERCTEASRLIDEAVAALTTELARLDAHERAEHAKWGLAS